MARNTQLSDEVVNLQADAVAALLNNGYLRVFGGTQPFNVETPVTDQPLITEHRFPNPAAGDAVAGVVTFNPIEAAQSDIEETATWFRAFKEDGTTPVFDGSIGVANANLILQDVAIEEFGTVIIESLTFTARKSAVGY